ncbi:MAG: ABC transporter substrate binding protein [Sulfurimonas sp.]|uniref:ABC transporter substrate-binding protein n=1 Tax=Sulfurimonas sp. TaxID=2022749 RepID=UPI0026146F66|nr:ABC transporter substrate binding protein [Sulfurimonas sp.]MDD5373056.1 ABC transporter substrate binding protein [Sulfurimonas sp.]
MNLFKIFFLLLCLAYSLYGSQKAKVFALHSYSQEYEWTKNQHSSFVSTLKKSANEFEIYSEYLDTKRVDLTPEYQNKFIEYLKTKYADASPDLIYVSDDNALNFIYEHYDKLFKNDKNKIPVFFSGINDFGMHEKLPSDIYTGVYELKEIKPNIELIKQFSPQTREVYIVGDNSNTYEFIKKEIQTQEAVFPNFKFHYIGESEIGKIQRELPNKPKTFVILTTIGNIKDEKNSVLLPNESIQRMKQNKNLIILSMEDAYMSEGVVGGYVTSGIKQGEEAANLVLKYLDEKTLKNVPSLLKSPNLYIFNSKELVEARVILSEYIARNSTIIGKDKDFIEKNQSTLLNIFAVIATVLFFTTVTLYVMGKKRDLQSQEL